MTFCNQRGIKAKKRFKLIFDPHIIGQVDSGSRIYVTVSQGLTKEKVCAELKQQEVHTDPLPVFLKGKFSVAVAIQPAKNISWYEFIPDCDEAELFGRIAGCRDTHKPYLEFKIGAGSTRQEVVEQSTAESSSLTLGAKATVQSGVGPAKARAGASVRHKTTQINAEKARFRRRSATSLRIDQR